MSVPMLDLRAQYAAIKPEIDAAVAEVLTTQRFRGGPMVEGFEQAVRDYLGVGHAVGVGSGSDALLLALKALDIGPGDEVITTPFTFFATAGAIANAGATPVFADIDPETYALDPLQVAPLVNGKTKAIVPVHLYGQCADMDPLVQTARGHGLYLIEDAAQALGARYHGRPAGALGDAAAFSFYPTKNLGAAGEGGMVASADDALAERVRLLRCHGSATQYVHTTVGINSHLDAIQAAVLGAKFRHLDDWNAQRRAHAAYYTERLADVPGVVTPREASGNNHVYHQYVIRIAARDKAKAFLDARGIGCAVFYPLPLHRQECFQKIGRVPNGCPEAERAAREVLALPMYPELEQAQLDEVVRALRDFAREAQLGR